MFSFGFLRRTKATRFEWDKMTTAVEQPAMRARRRLEDSDYLLPKDKKEKYRSA